MSTTRCANHDMGHYVNEREEFRNNNKTVYAYDTTSTTGTDLYIVHSYGDHFPLFIAEESEGVVNWYENVDKYSRTTERHRSHCRPQGETTGFTTGAMQVLKYHGIAGLAAGREV